MIQRKYVSIKKEIEQIVVMQMQQMMDTPKLAKLIIKKKPVQSKQH